MNNNQFNQWKNNNGMMNPNMNFQNMNNINNKMNNQGINNMMNQNRNIPNHNNMNMNANNMQMGNMNMGNKFNNNKPVMNNMSMQMNQNMNNMNIQMGNNMKSNMNNMPNSANFMNNNNFNNQNNNMNNKVNNNMSNINNNMNPKMNYSMNLPNNMNLQNSMNNQNRIGQSMNNMMNKGINSNMNNNAFQMNNQININNMNNNNFMNANMDKNMGMNNQAINKNNISNVNNFNNMNNMNNMSNNINNVNPNNLSNMNKMNNNINNVNSNNNMSNMNSMNNNINNINANNNMNRMNNNIIMNNMNSMNNNINNINSNNNINNNMNNPNFVNNMNNNNFNNNQINNNNIQNNINNMNNFGIDFNFMENRNQQNRNNMNQDNIQLLESQLMSIFNSNFKNNQLQTLQNENQILSYFYLGEKQCLDFINSRMNSNLNYIEYIFQELRNEFDNSQFLNHNITSQIIKKIRDIRIDTFTSVQQYYDCLKTNFGNVNVPKFLIQRDLEDLEGLIKYLNRNNKTTTIVQNIRVNNFQNSNSKKIIDYFEKMKNNMIQPFQGIDNTYDLFLLFLCENRRIFLKQYISNPFLCFLEWNINLIQQYFGNNINFQGIRQFLVQLNVGANQNNNIHSQSDMIFSKIQYSIINNFEKICNIISSFYILLFYKFKNIYKSDSKCNIENSHLTVSLKNVVIFLDSRWSNYPNNGINLFQLLMDLITYDVNCLIKFDNYYNQKNKDYNFNDINEILKDNERYIEFKKANIDKYQGDLDDGVITLIQKHLNNKGYVQDFQLYFKLRPIDKEIVSNSITILIDGADFKLKTNNFDWNQFISKFNGETNFYELCWPNKIHELNKKSNKSLRNIKFIAKTCGKLLGYILYSEKFFKNFQINLVGLNYGSFIVKNCLKELQKLNCIIENKKIFIKNVIFINGAISIKKKLNWTQIFENLIVDKVINCYSKEDNINELLKTYNLSIQQIGTEGLGINNVGNIYLQYEHDLTDFHFGKFNYDLSIPANISFANYNDL